VFCLPKGEGHEKEMSFPAVFPAFKINGKFSDSERKLQSTARHFSFPVMRSISVSGTHDMIATDSNLIVQ
jgi:hypothetical protein